MFISVRMQNCVICAVDGCFSVQDSQIISVNFCTMYKRNMQIFAHFPSFRRPGFPRPVIMHRTTVREPRPFPVYYAEKVLSRFNKLSFI